ncbi:MAG TPA: class I SAM-dependent methyltransferase [Acidimicrobiales bacterium]|nr:class I SAM-dependent methyltransferase [Acidimicrobiales bacterium]
MGAALLRAAHVVEDTPPWVLEDTVSAGLLTTAERALAAAELDSWPSEVRAAFRLAHAVRNRLAEDVAVEGLDAGRADYVVLGAGLDSFAWRHPLAARFRVVEIDHPATPRWKRDRLRAAGLTEPADVCFVPLDLTAASLAGIELPAPATWSWLGVAMYLEPPSSRRRSARSLLRAPARRSSSTSSSPTTSSTSWLVPSGQ